MEGGAISADDPILAQVSRPDLRAIYTEGMAAIAAAPDLASLEAVRVRFLGRKADLVLLLRSIPELPPEERPEVGKVGNLIRKALETALEERRVVVEADELLTGLERERIDVTLPGWPSPLGRLHLITQTQREIEDIFIGMGYEIAEGPEVETEYYNFEALNTPADHPARSLHDTFFVSESVLLRTHTSPMQVRTMEKQRPPVHIIVPGKAYRRDSDATHTPDVPPGRRPGRGRRASLWPISRAPSRTSCTAMFGADRKVRFRPHFFPFTEPSVEVDVSCIMCDGDGCRLCKKSGWLEILGAGMVDPNVFEFVGYDPEVYTGFAFGMGIERIAMLKHGVNDLRLFFENDLRFLRQF